jgi:hypothetical protein
LSTIEKKRLQRKNRKCWKHCRFNIRVNPFLTGIREE